MGSRADASDLAALGETRFRALTEALPALVFVTDTSGRNVFTNEWVLRFSSLPRTAMLGDGWLELLHPEDRDRARERWREAISGGKTFEGEFRFRHHSGQYRRHACRAEPTRDEKGEVVEWVGVCIDV
jgi:PAS domain S-box-containing protein